MNISRTISLVSTYALLAGSLTVVAGVAQASPSKACTDRPRAEWLSQDAVAEKLKQQGYTVRKVEEEKKSCYEVKARDAQGQRLELYVDPVSAKVVDSKRD